MINCCICGKKATFVNNGYKWTIINIYFPPAIFCSKECKMKYIDKQIAKNKKSDMMMKEKQQNPYYRKKMLSSKVN